MNVWILCNEDAGRGLSADDLRRLVEKAGHSVVGVAKEYDDRTPPPAGRLDLVVAAGGDGTVATVAGIAFETSAALAILPLGTANNIAASLGVRASAEELVSSWSTARRVPFDLGLARAAAKNWLVVEGVGGGLVPAGIARAQGIRRSRQELPPEDEIAAAIRTFREVLVDLEPRRGCLAAEGLQISGDFLLVEALNIRSIGPSLVFGPDATPLDGYFDIITAEERHREELLTYLDHRADGRDMRLTLPRCRTREVTIATCMELHIDDERVDASELGPISIRVEPAAIDVLL